MLGLELILFLLYTCQLGLSYKPPVLLEEPEDTFGYEKKPLTLKCRSTSSPPPRYLWFKDNNEVSNNRYTITDQGDLLISSFIAAEDVGIYKCVVKVAIEINNAELKLVSRNAKVQTEVFPQFFASDVYATTGYITGGLRLSVNTSNFNPEPNIGWNYHGKPSVQNNDPRFTVLPQGVLQISGLLSSDDGEIRAVAYSKATSQTMFGKFAKITVEEASLRPINKAFYFLGKPQSIELEWGYSTILEAFADSSAPISYTWYKDGNKVNFNDRISIFGKGNLKIQFSKDEDAGIYKVVAESAGQQIEASAQVKVNSPAQIILSPPSQVTATEESKVTVNFNVRGSSNVNWYHDGAIVDIASADYLQFGSDYVIINNLINSDAGMYQGRIGNTNIHMSFELIVVPKDTITTQSTVNSVLVPGKPLNVVAQVKSSTDIDLRWQEPAISNGAILSYGIIYFSSLTTAKRITVSDPTQRFLTVKNLSPGTMYQFRIQAFNSNGPSLFSDVVKAKTEDESSLPGIATNLKVLPFESSMTVSWDSPKSGAVQNYVVFYTPRGFSGNPLQKSASTTSLQIDNLTPGVSYRVWVVSYNNNIAGPKSEEVVVDFPNASEAPQSVTNFVVTPVLTTVTNLNWNPPLSGPVPTSYKVYYQDAEDSSSSLQVSSITSPPAIIRNLQPNTLYDFYVIPFNGAVAGLKSSIIRVRTLEEVPPAPLLLKAVSIGSETLKVRWSPIDLKDFHGNLLSYELQYFEGDLRQAAKVISDIPKASSEWKITKLLPQTLYNLNVRGVSGSGQGAASPTISVKTRELTSEGPSEPADVKFIHDPDAADVLMVTWDEPLYVTGDIKSYIVYYRVVPSDNWVSKTTIGSAKGYNITGILFGKSYESYMVAVDGNGEGRKSPVLKKATMIEDKQPDPVSQLTIVPKADSLLVSWEPPVSSSQVIVRGYKVSITNVKTKVEIFQNTLLGRKNAQVLLYNGIEPNERYGVSVQAFNQFGKSPLVKKEATTLQALKSAVLITGVTEGSNNIFFKWIDTGIVSGVANYIVRYDVYDINGVPETKNLAVFKNEAYIADLTPFTTYNFYVKHATETSFPTDVTVSARTLEAVPSAPLDLTAQGIGEYPSWLILSWQVPRYPNGKIKEYVILYSADEALDYKEWPKIETKSISMTHNITQLTAGTKYYFVVYAVNGAGEGFKSAMYSKTTVGGNAVVPIVPTKGASKADSSGGLELWWIILGIALFILLLLLLLLIIWCCCCRKDMGLCWSCCPCCKKCWFCCCLPCCLFCCPCCCKKHKDDKNKLYITTPVLTLTTNEKLNGHTVNESKDVNVEMVPLTSAVDGEMYGGDAGFGTTRSRMTSSSLNSSKVSLANIKVPIPGDATFISYKTSLQDYCQNIGWVPPVYSTNQGNLGWLSKVSFGKIHSYDNGYDYGTSKQDAEQRAAHVGLIGLGVLDFRSKYSDDSCISVPGQGDGSFISYKCSLHDFCQQCSLQPPNFVTSLYDNGYSSSVKVGNHTFNIIGRTSTSQEAEQKAALVALQGLCMVDSQAVYDPQACYTVPGPGDISFISFKSNLHDFCQKFALPPPQYITNQGPQGFSAKLKFGGLFFQSNDFFQTRLEAEQHAAFEALQGLGLLESSVSFNSAWETNMQSSLVRGNSLKHGSGIITLGSVGGSLPRSYSRQSSRNHSRSGSVSISRQGSMSELKPSLNVPADVVGVEINRLPPAPNIQSNRDTAYSMGPRTYSSGSGFDRSSFNDRAGTYASLGRTSSNNNTLVYNSPITSGYMKDGLSASQTHIIHSTPYTEHNGGDALFRYDSDFNDVTSKVNYTSQQLNKKESYRIGSTYSSSSISIENSSSSQYNGSRNYAGSVRDVSYVETPRTVRTASHPALGDLESEMAGLEGLIKDLNGIASKAI